MGIPGSANLMLLGGGAQAYEIEQSLRFNDDDSAHLSKTSTAGTQTAWTWSCWVKATRFDGTAQAIFGSAPAGTLYNDIGFDGGQFRFRQYHSSGGGNSWELKTDARYRDPSAWYHIVLRFDSAQSTSSDRVKIWINGAQVTDFANETYPGQNINSLINSQYEHGIGKLESTFNYYFDGYLAEMHFVDNDVTLTPEDFGEYDNNGVWRPIEVTGLTYGTRGFYLTFDPTATNGIGHDHSGNGLNWTPSNLTTSGGGTDVMSDTPTTNWCTWNPLKTGTNLTPEDGNLFARMQSNSSGVNQSATATIYVSSGKWYWEGTSYNTVSGYGQNFGIASESFASLNSLTGSTDQTYGYSYIGNKVNGATTSSYGASYTSNDVIGVALDLDAGTLVFYKNGANQGTAFTGISGTFTPYCGLTYSGGGPGFRTNFGQREFAYPPGTSSATQYFNTVTYTGTGATHAITGVGFQPDLVWIKHRNGNGNHNLFDSVRGTGKQLYPNLNDAEGDFATSGLTAFGTDGFTLGNSVNSDANISSNTYVAWCWKAGGTASSNTDGSITSSVSANQDAGFSVVTYTGTNTSGQTFGHGLGQIPSLVIVKCRDANNNNWGVWHKDLGSLPSQKNLYLASSAAVQTQADTTFGTFTNTTIEIGTFGFLGSTQDYVAYCWAEKAGVSKFGSYTGNGSNDGPEIDTGFKPALVIIKRTNSAENWLMFDSTRDTSNPTSDVLFANLSNAESANYTPQDFTVNGFKIRTSSTSTNASGSTYIYMAFAQNFSADDSFKALNTANLPAPDIADGSEYFNTALWTGNGGTQAVTGVGFQPDMTWVKSRSISAAHWINDAVRGAGYSLPPSNTLSEQDYRTLFTSFDSDGFSLASGTSSFNQTSATYVGWNWKANGSGSSNTAGSITSTVSANPTAGFSIVGYTGNATAGATVGHGLGVAPSMIITKNRQSTSEWAVYHSAIGNTKALLLNQTYNEQTNSLYWNNTSPTSTVFSLGAGSTTNSANTYAAYCFAEVENYSKFGSYVGNGSNNGPFVYCGFKPAFLLGKASSTTSQWFIWDVERNTYNPLGDILYPNLSSAELASALDVDFTSNGFKFREGGGAGNDSNVTYIFMAFAENPFGGDGVSPATAR